MVPPIHIQKDDVETNGGSLENVAVIFVLFFCGVQLVLRSNVFTILDLMRWIVAPSFAEEFRSVLSGVVGSTGGRRCSQPPSIAPCHFEEPTPLHQFVVLVFCSGTSYKVYRVYRVFRLGKAFHFFSFPLFLDHLKGYRYSCRHRFRASQLRHERPVSLRNAAHTQIIVVYSNECAKYKMI